MNTTMIRKLGFLSTACLVMVLQLLEVARCQDPVNLELLLSDARAQQQQPNIEQLLSAARVPEQQPQQLGPAAPLAAQIPVFKSNVIPDAGDDSTGGGEVRKFRPRLLRQRLRQTLTNLKNRESIIPLPSTVAPQDVTQTTPTPRPSRTSLFSAPRRRFRPRPREQEDTSDTKQDVEVTTQGTTSLRRRFPGLLRRPTAQPETPAPATTTTTTTAAPLPTAAPTAAAQLPAGVRLANLGSPDVSDNVVDDYEDAAALALFQNTPDFVPKQQQAVAARFEAAQRLPAAAATRPTARLPAAATRPEAAAAPTRPTRIRSRGRGRWPAAAAAAAATPEQAEEAVRRPQPQAAAPRRPRPSARRRRPVSRGGPAVEAVTAAPAAEPAVNRDRSRPVRIRNRQRGRRPVETTQPPPTPAATAAPIRISLPTTEPAPTVAAVAAVETALPFQQVPFEPTAANQEFPQEVFHDEIEQFENELDEIQHLKAAKPVTFQTLSFSNQGTPLISVNQIPAFQPTATFHQQPAQQSTTQAPEPLKLFDPSTFQFGSRQTARQQQPIREPVRQQQQPISEPVRQQQPISREHVRQQQQPIREPVRQQQQPISREPVRQQQQPIREPVDVEEERPRSQQTEISFEGLQPAAAAPVARPLPLHQRGRASGRHRSRVSHQQQQPRQLELLPEDVEVLPSPAPRRQQQQQQKPRRKNNRRKKVGEQNRVRVLERYSQENPDGSLTWGYENTDGSFKEETIGTNCVTQGRYGYVDVNGEVKEFTYETGIPCDPLTKQPLIQAPGAPAQQQQEVPVTRSVAREVGHYDYRTNRFVTPNGKRLKVTVNKNNRRRG